MPFLRVSVAGFSNALVTTWTIHSNHLKSYRVNVHLHKKVNMTDFACNHITHIDDANCYMC